MKENQEFNDIENQFDLGALQKFYASNFGQLALHDVEVDSGE